MKLTSEHRIYNVILLYMLMDAVVAFICLFGSWVFLFPSFDFVQSVST